MRFGERVSISDDLIGAAKSTTVKLHLYFDSCVPIKVIEKTEWKIFSSFSGNFFIMYSLRKVT